MIMIDSCGTVHYVKGIREFNNNIYLYLFTFITQYRRQKCEQIPLYFDKKNPSQTLQITTMSIETIMNIYTMITNEKFHAYEYPKNFVPTE